MAGVPPMPQRGRNEKEVTYNQRLGIWRTQVAKYEREQQASRLRPGGMNFDPYQRPPILGDDIFFGGDYASGAGGPYRREAAGGGGGGAGGPMALRMLGNMGRFMPPRMMIPPEDHAESLSTFDTTLGGGYTHGPPMLPQMDRMPPAIPFGMFSSQYLPGARPMMPAEPPGFLGGMFNGMMGG